MVTAKRPFLTLAYPGVPCHGHLQCDTGVRYRPAHVNVAGGCIYRITVLVCSFVSWCKLRLAMEIRSRGGRGKNAEAAVLAWNWRSTRKQTTGSGLGRTIDGRLGKAGLLTSTQARYRQRVNERTQRLHNADLKVCHCHYSDE